jgi:mono/diheme cytochrome c family protein
MRRALAALVVLSTIAAAGCAALSRMSGSSTELRALGRGGTKPTDVAMARFAFEDFGTLDTHTLETYASPWKLYSTALLMTEAPRLGLPVERASLRPVLEQFGYLFPDSVANWDPRAGPPPSPLEPLGTTRGMIDGWIPGLKLEVRNTGCAACHTGRVYDAQGMPTRTGWIGLPNTWLDLEGFSQATYAALKLAMRDEKKFLATVGRVYPRISWGERYVLRHGVVPRVRKALRTIVADRDRALVFDNGGPGLANGVASLKYQLGIISSHDYSPREMAIASIPDLSDRFLRSSLLADGTYAVRGDEHFRPLARAEVTPDRVTRFADVAVFFTVTTSGNDPATAERMIPRMREALRTLASYHAPRFPGTIDPAESARGAEVFGRRCASCHGRYEPEAGRIRLVAFPNALVPSARIATDSVRWMAVDDSVLQWQAGNPGHPFVRHIETVRTGGYVAPILSGVWATAPYLHNGSVPTLHALMHPDQRPERFEVGGHRLDYTRMGIALERDTGGVWRVLPGDAPRSRPVVYDTRAFGRANHGHTFPFSAMSEDEKRDVLEFLKTL